MKQYRTTPRSNPSPVATGLGLGGEVSFKVETMIYFIRLDWLREAAVVHHFGYSLPRTGVGYVYTLGCWVDSSYLA